MRYTLDFEFLEAGSPHGGSITPISIGIVAEDGREYYAEHSTFPWEGAEALNPWLVENVKPYLMGPDSPAFKDPNDIHQDLLEMFSKDNDPRPVFWGYYCDYDWVTFCWHFGKMVDLPKHFPMYCLDIKQEMMRRGIGREELPNQEGTIHNALDDARWMMRALEFMRIVP